MKKKIAVTLLIIILMLSTSIARTFAATKTELENKKNENESKIKEAEAKQEEIEEQIDETNKQIKNLTEQINEYKSQIDELDIKLSDLEDSIEETQDKLDEAEKKFDEQQETLQTRIVAQYEAGETTYLDVILGGGSLWDMISNWYIVSEIADKDNELLEQIEANKNEIEEAKKNLETSKTQVETLKNSKEETTKALKNSQAQKEEEVSKLNEDDKALQQKIDELNEENDKLTAELNEKAKEAEKKLNSGTVKPSTEGSVNFGGSGVLQRPVSGGVITATWYYPSGGFHGALDYGVSVGSTVYAAADGVVLYAGWTPYPGTNGGLGYMVVIQHADGLRTRYGHGNGVFYVSEGAVVSKGQPIMQSGNTGNSTGPHLHFEVQVSPYGSNHRVDPRNYL